MLALIYSCLYLDVPDTVIRVMRPCILLWSVMGVICYVKNYQDLSIFGRLYILC